MTLTPLLLTLEALITDPGCFSATGPVLAPEKPTGPALVPIFGSSVTTQIGGDVKLTQTSVKALKTDREREDFMDDETEGFGIRVLPSGKKRFFVRYYFRGRRRRLNVARLGVDTVEQARTKAKRALSLATLGIDPAVEMGIGARMKMPTWKEWVKEYLEGVELRKKAPLADRYYLKGHRGGRKKKGEPKSSEAMKRWGNRALDDINPSDIEALIGWAAEKKGNTTANRMLASIRACLAAAIRAGVLKSNPAMMVTPLPEAPPRQRVLTDEELKNLREAIAALENPEERVLLTMLLDTGCRLSEALRMQWTDIDFEHGVWTIPSPKAGHPQALPLTSSMALALSSLKRYSEFVFPGRNPNRPRTTIRRLWDRLKVEAKIEDVTIHDLRRTYGLRIARQAGILAASRLLRHSDTRVTSRVYAPLNADELREIAEKANNGSKVAQFPQSSDAAEQEG